MELAVQLPITLYGPDYKEWAPYWKNYVDHLDDTFVANGSDLSDSDVREDLLERYDATFAMTGFGDGYIEFHTDESKTAFLLTWG